MVDHQLDMVEYEKYQELEDSRSTWRFLAYVLIFLLTSTLIVLYMESHRPTCIIVFDRPSVSI